MKASKQHFELVQRVLLRLRRGTTLDADTDPYRLERIADALSEWFADEFARSNKSGFDRARFLAGCGVSVSRKVPDAG